MRKGYRVIGSNQKGTVKIRGESYDVVVMPDANLISQINLHIEEDEREVEDQNAKAGGFVPFALWQECSRVTVDLAAGLNDTISVPHKLVSRSGVAVVPNAYLVTYPGVGDYSLVPVEPWSQDVARFAASSTAGTKLKIVFWRDA